MPSASDRLDQRRQQRPDQARPEPGDQGQPAWLGVGIEPLDQRPEVVRASSGTDLDANGVADGGGESHVRAVDGPGPLADPQEVRGQVVQRARCAGSDPGEGLLVRQQQGLVAGVELDAAQLVRSRRRRRA